MSLIQQFRCAWAGLVVALTMAGVARAGEGFVSLFDGQTLDGWVQRGGDARFFVRDGLLVGQSVPKTPGSYLCTEREFGDFILEYEFLCDAELNSGVQIRSQYFEQETELDLGNGQTKLIPAGRVVGYQVEIDPNKPDRMWTAGVQEASGRSWLYPGPAGGDEAEFSAQGIRLYKPGEWNHTRVECVGTKITTWLNGELRVEMRDERVPRGFLGIQVHGVGKRADPLEVRFRNIRIQTRDR